MPPPMRSSSSTPPPTSSGSRASSTTSTRRRASARWRWSRSASPPRTSSRSGCGRPSPARARVGAGCAPSPTRAPTRSSSSARPTRCAARAPSWPASTRRRRPARRGSTSIRSAAPPPGVRRGDHPRGDDRQAALPRRRVPGRYRFRRAPFPRPGEPLAAGGRCARRSDLAPGSHPGGSQQPDGQAARRPRGAGAHGAAHGAPDRFRPERPLGPQHRHHRQRGGRDRRRPQRPLRGEPRHQRHEPAEPLHHHRAPRRRHHAAHDAADHRRRLRPPDTLRGGLGHRPDVRRRPDAGRAHHHGPHREHGGRGARRADGGDRRSARRHAPPGRALGPVSREDPRPRRPLPQARRPAHEDEPARLPDAARDRLGRADGRHLGRAARADAGSDAEGARPPPRARRAVVAAPGARAAVTGLEDAAAARLAISPEALERARARRREGGTLAEALADLGAADSGAFTRALADVAALPFVPVPPALPARELVDALPMPYARRHLVLPLARGPEGLEVAIGDPGALAPLDDLRLLYGTRLLPVVVPPPALRDASTLAYGAVAGSAADTMEAIEEERLELADTPDDALGEPLDLLETGDEAPVIRLVNALFCQAVKDGASDIHVEPYERAVTVRFRVDGLLHDVLAPPAHLHARLVSRLKIMARLDIAERRLPQDGRIRIRVAGRDVDVRVSIAPTAFGERAVLRLLDRAGTPLELERLGLAPALEAAIDRVLGQSHGLLLVTGPTGSGKTTTLYAALRRLVTGERNILTIEDPIEYQLAGIGQMPVKPVIGIDFAIGPRAILRQGPDVLVVGEIRVRESR